MTDPPAWSLPRTRNAWRACAIRTAAIGAVAAALAAVFLLAGLALAALITGACCLRLARWRRAFARAPWQVWSAEPGNAVPGRGSDARWIIFTTQPTADSAVAIILGLQAWLRFQEAVTWQPTGQTIWYLPGPHRRGIILPSDAKVPLTVRLPRSPRAVASIAQRTGRPGLFS